MNSKKIRDALGWRPRHTFEVGLGQTVAWYRDNSGWSDHVRSGEYQSYYERQYGALLSAGKGGA
jgi:dTDP-glucose 4,6-dehydratase